MTESIARRMTQKLGCRDSYHRGYHFALVAAALAAIVHIAWFAVWFSGFRERIGAATMVIIDWNTTIVMMHVRIAVALIISVGGLFSRRLVGVFLSALALGWVALEYAAWFSWTVRMKSNAGIETLPSSIPHASHLYGASPWNVVVFVLTVAVLLWETGGLVKIAMSKRFQASDGGEPGG